MKGASKLQHSRHRIRNFHDEIVVTPSVQAFRSVPYNKPGRPKATLTLSGDHAQLV